MKNRLMTVLFALVAFVSLPSFAQFSGTDFGMGGVRVQQVVQEAVVIDVVKSNVAVEASGMARMAGGGIGAAVCATAMHDSSNYLARAALTTACGVAGERIANQVGSSNTAAQTFVVRMANGQTLAVTQADPDIFVGQRVYVLQGQGTRIVKAGV
jgi:outer membrane lipoprotein SlyB